MLRLELVKSTDEYVNRLFEDGNPLETAVLQRLVHPWFNTNRVICADS